MLSVRAVLLLAALAACTRPVCAARQPVEPIRALAVAGDGVHLAVNERATFMCGVTGGLVGGQDDPAYFSNSDPEPDFAAYASALRDAGVNLVRVNGTSMAEGAGRVGGANTLPGEEPLGHPPEAPYTRRPWARSDQGIAWDGLPRYDLGAFDTWYFDRLNSFVATMNDNGIAVEFTFFHQSCVAESFTNWADSPWRPENNTSSLGLPSREDAYPAFFSLQNTALVEAQKAYVDQCVSVLRQHAGVLYCVVDGYNGPSPWVEHWAKHIRDLLAPAGQPVVSVGAALDCTRMLTQGKSVDCFHASCFGLLPDGKLCTPPSQEDVAAGGFCGDEFFSGPAVDATVAHLLGQRPAPYVTHGDDSVDSYLRALAAGSAGRCHRGSSPSDESRGADAAVGGVLARVGDLTGWTPRRDMLRGGKGLCLARPGTGCVLYVTDKNGAKADLPAVLGAYTVEWRHPMTGEWLPGGSIAGGKVLPLEVPVPVPAVAVLMRQAAEPGVS